MIGMTAVLMLLSGQVATPPDESAKVDSVTVTADGKKATLQRWSAPSAGRSSAWAPTGA